MNITFDDYAVKNIHRFKNLSEYEVEDIVRNSIEDDEFQDYLEDCHSGVCSHIYNKDTNITVFIEIDDNDVTIKGVKRGDQRF